MLFDDLEGWDRGRDRKEAQRKGDIPIQVIHLIVLMIVKQLYNIVKQLYPNKNNEQVI